ncbi:MAG TPA: TolC family protein [Nitrospirota bacterium]|nr:TolC family protein [Nitrospirota bacterium]
MFSARTQLIVLSTVVVLLLSAAYPAAALTLKECITAALSHNPTIAEAQLGIESAEESVASAEGKHWPRLSVDGSYTNRKDPLPYIPAKAVNIPARFDNEFSALSVTLSLPLYQGGQVTNSVSLAQVRRDIQEQTARQTKYDIMANTVNTYNKILQLNRLHDASQTSVKALEEQVRNSRLLLDVGRIARVDLLKVEVQLANEEQRLLSIDEGLKTAASTLIYLMGESPNSGAGPPLLADQLSVPLLNAGVDEGILLAHDRRPEYQAAQKGVEEAEYNRRIATGKLLPSLSVYAGYLDQYGFNIHHEEANWQTGLILSIPLFDRSSYADVAREKIQKRRSELRLVAVNNQIRLEVGNAVASLKESQNRITSAEKAVAQAEESFRIEQMKYATGAGTVVDLLLAQAASVNAAANYIQALFDYNAAVVSYRKATGTLEDFLK